MPSDWVLFDAGVFVGALLIGDPRHANAAHLRHSVAEAQMGKTVERELIEP